MKGAILIIGSLLWDPDQGEYKNFREKWRNKHLNMDDSIHVFAPIRYGRESKGRPAHTMVLSKETDTKEKLGTAYVVPFKNNPLTSDEVLSQAKELSKAEGKGDDKLVKGNQKKWCVIGLLFNPSIDLEKKKGLLDKFTLQLQSDGLAENHRLFKIGNEPSILNENGEIKISWLEPVDTKNKEDIDSFDFIMATCTRQNLKNYPDADEILRLVKIDNKQKYFLNNNKHGISTFQDQEIIDKLNEL
ncbi:MAG: hypothetical protein BGO88_08485 [Flavobacterium sp. 38-13]|uniref:hypothetical protein n=1 Tax=Flavobacterium sp. 38-13 TaxID=1896168 RepID=UPI000969964F|nr:hypothetical protein [Flavobacterium sp. 38-13]OJX49783.1 MAG: hypothetical protein BGO88_08485 [Flavobacterium sp. 38-13]